MFFVDSRELIKVYSVNVKETSSIGRKIYKVHKDSFISRWITNVTRKSLKIEQHCVPVRQKTLRFENLLIFLTFIKLTKDTWYVADMWLRCGWDVAEM